MKCAPAWNAPRTDSSTSHATWVVRAVHGMCMPCTPSMSHAAWDIDESERCMGSETAAPQEPARSTQPGAERDCLGVGQAADEIDDPATAAHPRQLGIGDVPAEPLGVLLGHRLICPGGGVHQVQQPSRRPACVDAV